VRVDDNERESLVAAGVVINGIHLLSLRGMFEQAVGLSASSGTLGNHGGSSTQLSQTLGFHMDTPMLAPFLGKEVKKKMIHVYDDEDILDISSQDDCPLLPSTCIMKFRPRKSDTTDCSINAAALVTEQNGNVSFSQPALPETFENQKSRFHVTRRVIVSDRSLYLSESWWFIDARVVTKQSHISRRKT
jgi:hypothetical protein